MENPRHRSDAGRDGAEILVVGQIARDLILSVEQLPEAGGSTPIRTRIEQLGGKGANQAVGLAQLGARVAVLGVVGEDDQGERVLRTARQDGIDTTSVVRRGTTALLLDVVDSDGERRLFEHVPEEAEVTADDVERSREAVRAAGTVSLQLQQPADALIAAARLAADAGARVALDGHAEERVMRQLLPLATVVRADAQEAQMITGTAMSDVDTAVGAARSLLDRGVEVVAFSTEQGGNVVVWSEGHRYFAPDVEQVVDRTGAGDAFMAGLLVGLRATGSPGRAGELAAACAASTVQRLGGRPDLTGLRP
jgi:ribokinase